MRILNTREILFVSGAGVLGSLVDDALKKQLEYNQKCQQCLDLAKRSEGCLASFDAITKRAADCKCLDFNDKESPIIVVRTMDDCWEFCCKTHNDYHAAKFGKYSRDC
jgi:hypothetical protein